VKRAAEAAVKAWREAVDGFRLHEAAGAIRALVSAIDGYITLTEPWKKAKAEGVTPALRRIHHNTLEGLRIAAVLLAPIAPGSASEVLSRLGVGTSAADLTEADLAWGGLPLDAPLAVAPPLFPRADPKLFFANLANLANHKETKVTDEKKPDAPNVNATAPIAASDVAAAVAAANAAAAGGTVAAPATSAAPAPGAKIPIDDFLKLDLRVGEVIAAEKVEKSKKLMKMTVKIGEEVRTIVGGIALAYAPEQLVGRKFVFVANLAPAKLMGVESNGMILAATLPDTGEPSLLMVEPAVPSGAKVK